jgi:hypothetical protein
MGAPQLFSEKCSSCVFRSGNPMHLKPGRLTEILKHNIEHGTALICHKTLDYGEHPEIGETVCRGFYDAYGENINVIRVMHRLGGFKEVDPP